MDDIEIGDPEGADGADPLAKLKRLKEKLSHCEKEKAEYLEGWQRAKADLINFKKDEGRRLESWRVRLEEAMLLEFLSVLDSFELALHENQDAHLSEGTKRGFDLIRSQLVDVFRRLGVTEIGVKGKFDPLYHEAIEEVESSVDPGTVIEVAEKGYARNGQILRPARVKVAKQKP